MAEPKDLFIDLRSSVSSPEARQALRDAHSEWVSGLQAQGKIVMAGPFADGSGGVIIFSVGSLEEAIALSNQDPYVVNGLLKPNIKTWTVRFY